HPIHSHLSRDYHNFYKQKYRHEFVRLIIGLIIYVSIFLFFHHYTYWYLFSSFILVIAILLLNFSLFKCYNLFILKKKIKKLTDRMNFGKMNLIFKNNQIEILQNNSKRVIFKSQLIECLLLGDALFFIEKNNKYFPFKVNKAEISEASFEHLMRVLA